ncbi:hypothetical protein HY605_06070 [Candidatus Peregrinibacteria bacterium]|nr:hypothetical protein [Candidatus Peregrinibacteria bacterium]
MRSGPSNILDAITNIPSLRARFVDLGIQKPFPSDFQVIEWMNGENRESLRACLQASGRGDREITDLERNLDDGKVLKTFLTPNRQLEILRQISRDLAVWIQGEHCSDVSAGKELELDKAQWATLATAEPNTYKFDDEDALQAKCRELDSLGLDYQVNGLDLTIFGARVSFAFYKNPCHYRVSNSDGCRFCNLSADNLVNVGEITTAQQLAALEDALARTRKLGAKMTTFEILPDGQFIFSSEVPVETQVGMMQRLSEEPTIHRVAIETRAEYLQARPVKRLLTELRGDQKLNIYLGLETTDEFVASIINNKGYCFAELKKAIRKFIAAMDKTELERIELSVYSIIKPAYLTDHEAVEMTIITAREVQAFASEIGIPISIKCEPGVVSSGTIQHFLNNEKDPGTGEPRYRPPSYFSIAEILARFIEEDLDSMVKFGQRDDIDYFSNVAMVPSADGSNFFSVFDYLVYNAVQRFNTKKDRRQFILDLRLAIEHSDEFKNWEIEMYGQLGSSALSRLFQKESTNPLNDEERKVEDFQKLLWKLADKVEYSLYFSSLVCGREECTELEDVKREVEELFRTNGVDLFKVGNFVFLEEGLQFEVILFNESGYPQSLWLKIPYEPSLLELITPGSEFIYG